MFTAALILTHIVVLTVRMGEASPSSPPPTASVTSPSESSPSVAPHSGDLLDQVDELIHSQQRIVRHISNASTASSSKSLLNRTISSASSASEEVTLAENEASGDFESSDDDDEDARRLQIKLTKSRQRGKSKQHIDKMHFFGYFLDYRYNVWCRILYNFFILLFIAVFTLNVIFKSKNNNCVAN